MKKFFSLLLLLSSLLSAAVSDFQQEFPLSVTESGNGAIVAGCIHILTGEYVESKEDLFLDGVEPLSLTRSYCSAGSPFSKEIPIPYYPYTAKEERSMNKQMIGKELKLQLEKGYDIVRISRWASRIFSDNIRSLDVPLTRNFRKFICYGR